MNKKSEEQEQQPQLVLDDFFINNVFAKDMFLRDTFLDMTLGLYYEHITIVNDDSIIDTT
jgi:hypothetical protein